MQNSELYRRGMVVPLSQDALGAIRSSTVSESTSVAVASLATESDFEWLWAKGFFAEINDRTGALLDDYEEEEIGVEHVVDVLRVATQFQSIRACLRRSARSLATWRTPVVVLLTGRCLCSSFCDSRNSLGPPPAPTPPVRYRRA